MRKKGKKGRKGGREGGREGEVKRERETEREREREREKKKKKKREREEKKNRNRRGVCCTLFATFLVEAVVVVRHDGQPPPGLISGAAPNHRVGGWFVLFQIIIPSLFLIMIWPRLWSSPSPEPGSFSFFLFSSLNPPPQRKIDNSHTHHRKLPVCQTASFRSGIFLLLLLLFFLDYYYSSLIIIIFLLCCLFSPLPPKTTILVASRCK